MHLAAVELVRMQSQLLVKKSLGLGFLLLAEFLGKHLIQVVEGQIQLLHGFRFLFEVKI